MKRLILSLLVSVIASVTFAQAPLKKVYDEQLNRMEQIDKALAQAKTEGKYVICQVGGNWCPWCLRFADFITNDSIISKTVDDNFVYIHVNYARNARNVVDTPEVMKRLGNPARFGFPVMVVLNSDGEVLHIQDSSYLEEGKGYNHDKVLGFFSQWTPAAVETLKY